MPDSRERIAVLENQIKHLDVEIGKVARQVDEMHSMLMQAKGFRYALIAFVSIVSFFTGTILPLWLNSK